MDIDAQTRLRGHSLTDSFASVIVGEAAPLYREFRHPTGEREPGSSRQSPLRHPWIKSTQITTDDVIEGRRAASPHRDAALGPPITIASRS